MTTFHHCQENVERAVARTGSHFFDADTMRYFGSKTYELHEPRDSDTAWLVMSNRDRGYYSELAGRWVGAFDCRRYYFVVGIRQLDEQGYEAEIVRVGEPMPSLDGSEHGTRGYWTLNAARRLAKRLAAGEVMAVRS